MAGVKDARLDAMLAVEVVEGVVDRPREAVDVFFASVWGARGGFVSELRDGFFRKVSADEASRSWDWLLDGLSTGSLDVGRGIPEERTGIDEGRSIASWRLTTTASTGTEEAEGSKGESLKSRAGERPYPSRATGPARERAPAGGGGRRFEAANNKRSSRRGRRGARAVVGWRLWGCGRCPVVEVVVMGS